MGIASLPCVLGFKPCRRSQVPRCIPGPSWPPKGIASLVAPPDPPSAPPPPPSDPLLLLPPAPPPPHPCRAFGSAPSTSPAVLFLIVCLERADLRLLLTPVTWSPNRKPILRFHPCDKVEYLLPSCPSSCSSCLDRRFSLLMTRQLHFPSRLTRRRGDAASASWASWGRGRTLDSARPPPTFRNTPHAATDDDGPRSFRHTPHTLTRFVPSSFLIIIPSTSFLILLHPSFFLILPPPSPSCGQQWRRRGPPKVKSDCRLRSRAAGCAATPSAPLGAPKKPSSKTDRAHIHIYIGPTRRGGRTSLSKTATSGEARWTWSRTAMRDARCSSPPRADILEMGSSLAQAATRKARLSTRRREWDGVT